MPTMYYIFFGCPILLTSNKRLMRTEYYTARIICMKPQTDVQFYKHTFVHRKQDVTNTFTICFSFSFNVNSVFVFIIFNINARFRMLRVLLCYNKFNITYYLLF